MTEIEVISSTRIEARNQNGEFNGRIDLTPWDLQFLPFEAIQQGIAIKSPLTPDIYIPIIKTTLSSTLHFFHPLAGRLTIIDHNDNTSSVFINCNNAGALLVHARPHNTCSVSDILAPHYVPRIVHSLFPLNGAKNYEGTSKPLLAVQVTELVDGLFIGCSINHCVVDGMSFYHFLNSWIEMFQGFDKVSKLPTLERWFLDGVDCPIRIPFTMKGAVLSQSESEIEPLPERIFHFTKEKIGELKGKANAEVNNADNKISSLQALLSHVWRSVVRNQGVDPEKEVSFVLVIDVRRRIMEVGESYFGNALHVSKVSMKAGELVEGGVGKGGWEMNKVVCSQTEEKLKREYECWVKKPVLFTVSGMTGNALATSGSPRFHMFGNNYGFEVMGIRCGPSNKANGKLTLFSGPQEGSIDVEVCLRFEVLEGMAKDPDFMHAVALSI